MDERTCDCGSAFTKTPGPGRWPKRCPQCRSRKLTPAERSTLARRAVQTRHARNTTYERECQLCGETFQGFTRTTRFCSKRCRRTSSYERMKADPTAWAAYLDRCKKDSRRRNGYTQVSQCRACKAHFPTRPGLNYYCSSTCAQEGSKRCSVDGCDRKHLAKGMCRSHYYKSRRDAGLDGSATRRDVLMSTASLHGAYFPKLKPVKVSIAVGLLVECPACSALMTALNPTDRSCRWCGTTLTLNAEEVSWLTSATRSTRASLPTASC